jgi:hypothetical protein
MQLPCRHLGPSTWRASEPDCRPEPAAARRVEHRRMHWQVYSWPHAQPVAAGPRPHRTPSAAQSITQQLRGVLMPPFRHAAGKSERRWYSAGRTAMKSRKAAAPARMAASAALGLPNAQGRRSIPVRPPRLPPTLPARRACALPRFLDASSNPPKGVFRTPATL